MDPFDLISPSSITQELRVWLGFFPFFLGIKSVTVERNATECGFSLSYTVLGIILKAYVYIYYIGDKPGTKYVHTRQKGPEGHTAPYKSRKNPERRQNHEEVLRAFLHHQIEAAHRLRRRDTVMG